MNTQDIRFEQPTRQKFYDLLSDGEKHQVRDFEELLRSQDNLDPRNCVRVHIAYMRKVLNPLGLDIVAQHHSGRTWYRMMRTI